MDLAPVEDVAISRLSASGSGYNCMSARCADSRNSLSYIWWLNRTISTGRVHTPGVYVERVSLGSTQELS